MRLIRLGLENFRQHASTEVRFRAGLTGIIGPNGSGKSTLLEAIAWAIYGSAAARGTNETLRFSRATRRSRVEVDLAFELGGHEYRVVRTLHDAEVTLDGGGPPVATGIAGVTHWLQSRLGMNRDEFFNTYFTGQKELQFLANMGPTDRGRFLNRLLGYERLRIAQEKVRDRRGDLRHELEGLRAGQADPIKLEEAIAAADHRLHAVTTELEAAELLRTEAAARVTQIVPRWAEAQKRRDLAREQTHALERARQELNNATRDLERSDRALAEVAAAEAEQRPLTKELAELPSALAECDRLEALQRAAERRAWLEQSVRSAADELAEMVRRIETLQDVPRLVAQYTTELTESRGRFAEAEAAAETQRTAWTGRKQEVETKLTSYIQRAQELKDKISDLRKAGPEGTCPTCERPLHGEFTTVLGRLEDEYDTLVQDGKWLRQRQKQLAKEPEELRAAELQRDRMRGALETEADRLGRCEQAAQELWTLASDRQKKEKRLAELRSELAQQPAGYDAEAHRLAEQRLDRLRQQEKRAAALAAAVAGRSARQEERREAQSRAAAARRQMTKLQKDQQKLGWSEEEYSRVRTEHDAAQEALRRAELHAVELTGHVQTAEESRRGALRELALHRKREAAGRSLETELRHHNELDSALSQLRSDLNARVRPELGELASAFLSDVTDGRYNAIEIDEDYNILVLDEGEQKPVISGGEEDIANLVLRLAISQMIAERAGQQLSILILDEVFGSLDVEHRDNVVQLLHRLEGRFEQVILITHIEGIREGLDNVIRVDFDERTGASRVTEESVSGSLWTPQLVT